MLRNYKNKSNYICVKFKRDTELPNTKSLQHINITPSWLWGRGYEAIIRRIGISIYGPEGRNLNKNLMNLPSEKKFNDLIKDLHLQLNRKFALTTKLLSSIGWNQDLQYQNQLWRLYFLDQSSKLNRKSKKQ